MQINRGLVIHQRTVEGAQRAPAEQECRHLGESDGKVAMGNTCAGVNRRAASVGRGRRIVPLRVRGRKSQEGGIKAVGRSAASSPFTAVK